MSYDFIMAILATVLHLRLAALHLKVSMVFFVAMDTPNPALQVGTTSYFVTQVLLSGYDSSTGDTGYSIRKMCTCGHHDICLRRL